MVRLQLWLHMGEHMCWREALFKLEPTAAAYDADAMELTDEQAAEEEADTDWEPPGTAAMDHSNNAIVTSPNPHSKSRARDEFNTPPDDASLRSSQRLRGLEAPNVQLPMTAGKEKGDPAETQDR